MVNAARPGLTAQERQTVTTSAARRKMKEGSTANAHLTERSSFNPFRDVFSHRKPSGEILRQNNEFQARDKFLRSLYLLFRTVSLSRLVISLQNTRPRGSEMLKSEETVYLVGVLLSVEGVPGN